MMRLAIVILFALSQVEAQNRIVGGENAIPHSHPWQASLRYRNSDGIYSHICGAVILNSRWALTAAHCLDGFNAGELQVVSGGHSLSTPSEFEVTSSLSRVIMHPSYDSNALGYPNDIGLVEFNSPVSENGGIQYATLPPDDSNDFSSSSECYITGWGRTTDGGPLPDILQVAPITVLTNSACQSALGFIGILGLRATNICIDGRTTSSACNGDSGGPAVCRVGNNMQVVGVTSWGTAGCPVNSPSVYTRNSKYLAWISSYTG